MTLAAYSVVEQAQHVFKDGILANPLIQKHLPAEAGEATRHITFEGSDAPSLPINWRFAESISALLAYEATLINILLKKKYGIEPARVKINTDHAKLFIMASLLWVLDPKSANLSSLSTIQPEGRIELAKFFPNEDKHQSQGSLYRAFATNIYKTKDAKFFHLHGSMNPEPTLQSLGLPSDMKGANEADSLAPLVEAVSKRTAEEMQDLADQYRQAGTICWTIDEFKNSEHDSANTSAPRPLAGLKVIDLTRVIAGPAISKGLAELGASVMRITAPHLTDISVLHPDLNHGKWNASLDLRQEYDREKLRQLALGADVFLQGYRPGVLEKFGFGEQDILDMVRDRERGIIYCGENCYGWQGPWMNRSGWQQISDACCGVSYEFGRAMGNDEPVTPVFPNSDYCTGVAGISGIITALLRRADEGGSFSVDIALNYYSQWLVNSVGTYPAAVWQDVWKQNGSLVFRHYHPMQHLLPKVLGAVHNSSADKPFRPEFFTEMKVKNLGKDIRFVAPVLQYPRR